jgi:hypothetical protein
MNPSKYFFLILALSLASAELQAVLMKSLPIEELSQKADLIVLGTVLSKSCQRDDSGRIYTKIELQVIEVWKGSLATNSFTIVHGGGTVGNRRVEVSGQVEYEVGEEVVAFLRLNQRGEGVTIGLAQGKFRVWTDKATGERFAYNILHGVAEKAAAHEGEKSGRLALRDLAQRAKGGAR